MVFNYETRKDLIQQRESLLEEVEDLRLDILEYEDIIQTMKENAQIRDEIIGFKEEAIQYQKGIIISKAKRINALQQFVNSLLREKGAEPMFTEDDFEDEEIEFQQAEEVFKGVGFLEQT